MVKFSDTQLDRTFSALSDPTRRALLARLESDPGLSISELARPFSVSLPAIMKHLDVLSGAKLIERRKTGRTVVCELRAEPMQEAMDWLNTYQRFWAERLDRLAAYVEEESWKQQSKSQRSPASPSSAISKRPRPESMPPGRTPRK